MGFLDRFEARQDLLQKNPINHRFWCSKHISEFQFTVNLTETEIINFFEKSKIHFENLYFSLL